MDRLSQFAVPGFDVEQYIRNQLKGRNEDDIHSLQSMLEDEKKKASSKLQSSVFRNYPQFIDASNQIANMEGDLLQLRNLLTELRTVVKGLGDISSIPSASAPNFDQAIPDRVRRQELQAESQWALDALYDLDVLISQRNFDAAAKLIDETKEKARGSSVEDAVISAVALRSEKLADRLLDDLPTPLLSSTERRNIVAYLAGLGKIEKARDIYLAALSKWIRQRMKSIKFEGDISEYASELSSVVLSQLIIAVDDFQFLFQDSRLLSSFVMWVSKEISKYADSFARQVFHTDNFRVMAECLDAAYESLRVLDEKGLGMAVVARKCFQPHLAVAIEAYCMKLQRSVEKRLSNELWRGKELRVSDGGDGDRVVKLTESAKFLYLATHRLVSDLGRILGPELYAALSQGLSKILEGYLTALSNAAYSGDLSDAQSLAIVGDAFFVVEDLVPRILRQLQRRFGHALPSLDKLRKQLSDIYVGLQDSYATHRAQLLLHDQMQWSEGMTYSVHSDLENELKTKDVTPKSPSKSFVSLVEFLGRLRHEIARFVGKVALPPILSSVALELAARLDDARFWERNADLSISGLNVLVLDMRFFLTALGSYSSDATVEFVEGIIGKGVMLHYKKYGGDPTSLLLSDSWFEEMAVAQMASMSTTLSDPILSDGEEAGIDMEQ